MRKLFSITAMAQGADNQQRPPDQRAESLEVLVEELDFEELLHVAKAVSLRISKLRSGSREEAKQAIAALVELSGLSVAELISHLDPTGLHRLPEAPVLEYVDPVSGRVWRGRGRKPNWIKDFEESGGSLSEIARAPGTVGRDPTDG